MSTHDLRSVLYVDDDPDICAVVETTLSAIGNLAVRTADSGEVAIDLASEEQPDLILMDVMMPGLDGPSTLKIMRGRKPLADIPVIFLTAKVMPAEVKEFLNLGAVGVIGKPFDPTRLCRDIRNLWERTGRTSAARDVPRGRAGEVEARVMTLAGAFLHRMQRDSRRLRCLVERLGAGDMSATEELRRLAHSIHGSGAMFGFPAISECGGAMEDLAEELAKVAPGTFDPRAVPQLSNWTSRLEAALDREGITLQSSAEGSSPALEAVHS